MTIKISHIFGPTIQGEGSAAGRHCLFVRVYNCNLECTWCDTAYTWADTPTKAEKTISGELFDRNEPKYGLKKMSVREVLEALRCLWDIENMPTIIVVSGGEPMMQQAELLPLLRILTSYGHEVHIETAGTIAPTKEFNSVVTQYNCSPKLLHSGNVLSKRFKPIVIKAINDTNKAWFKFVVSDDIDVCFEEIAHIATTCDLPYDRIMVMPEGSTPSENIALAQKIVDRALVRGWGLSFRTHVLLWGDDKDK